VSDQPLTKKTGRKTYRIFVRDLEMIGSVGVHAHEKITPQRIRVSIDLTVGPRAPDATDTVDTVLSYENVVKATRAIVASGHFQLIETLAERVAAACLQHYSVNAVKVKIEKPDIFPDAATVGIEIERP
jgi:dihydroneopterin aldolase